jgi:hypothetical protein
VWGLWGWASLSLSRIRPEPRQPSITPCCQCVSCSRTLGLSDGLSASNNVQLHSCSPLLPLLSFTANFSSPRRHLNRPCCRTPACCCTLSRSNPSLSCRSIVLFLATAVFHSHSQSFLALFLAAGISLAALLFLSCWRALFYRQRNQLFSIGSLPKLWDVPLAFCCVLTAGSFWLASTELLVPSCLPSPANRHR